jgi:hypothetical protein
MRRSKKWDKLGVRGRALDNYGCVAGNFSMPLISSVDKITRSYIAGWVADSERPDEPVDVLVYVNGEGRGRVTANLVRDDLRAAFPGATGSHAFRFEFGWPLSPFRRNEVEIFDAHQHQLLHAGKRTLHPQGENKPIVNALGGSRENGPMPILVTSTGRSGSSLLMRRLAAHPEIVVAGSHPYEVKQLTYYAGALRTLSLEANWACSMNPDALLSEASRYVTGFNPFHDPQFGTDPLLEQYWEVTGFEILTSAFRELIVTYYEAIRTMTHKASVRYFAEKTHPNPLVRDAVIAMFGGVKEILLVRDPRDLVCSYRAFWGATPSDAISLICSQCDDISNRVAAATADTLSIKYEDLVVQPDETLDRMSAFLGLSQKPVATDVAEGAIFGTHGTSRTPAESIGRWRQDLTSEQIKLCEAAFAELLPKLGYA